MLVQRRTAAPDALTADVAISPGLTIGNVTACDDEVGALTVTLEQGATVRAAVAVGCIVRPIEGDRVLLYRDQGEAFVLNVLERSAHFHATLALPGNGNLAIEAETLSVNVKQRMSLKAGTLDLQAKVLAMIGERTTWLSDSLTAIVQRWRSVAKDHELTADTMTVKATDRVAVVERVDALTAGCQSTRILGVATETAQSKVVAVTDDLRFDGKRVTVG